MQKLLTSNRAIIIIIFIAILLRLINVWTNSLYGDELTIALDAYSLSKTGQDQLGNFMPLTFPMGAGRPAGYVYGSVPFVALFGPTALGVRALSILSGIGILILLYLLGKRLFSEKAGLLAAAIGAVSPWDISLSRGGFEAHFALFLALSGVYLFMMAKQKPILYIFSAFIFGLTLHTYPTYKLSLLLFLPLLVWYQGGREVLGYGKRYFAGGAIVLIALGILSLSQTFIGGSETRFADINIFSQDNLKSSIEQKINLERQITNLPKFMVKYFHNKPVEYVKVLVENYLQNFSLDFLVLHGDRNPRHNMATMGEIYFVELILIITGLIAFWYKQRRIIIFLILWLLLSPIPTAIVDTPHALRSAFMLPPLILLSALGLLTILNYRNKIMISLVLLLFIIQFVFFAQKSYFLAPNEYSNFWSYPAKLASEIALKEKERFDYIILSDKIDNIEYAYPVYAKLDPSLTILQNQKRTILENNRFKQLENIYIGSISNGEVEKFLDKLDGSVLYLGSVKEVKGLREFESIIGLDGNEALGLIRK